MPDAVHNQLVIRTIANGATAQLRVIIDLADREEARRIHADIMRMATQLAIKHDFDKERRERKAGR